MPRISSGCVDVLAPPPQAPVSSFTGSMSVFSSFDFDDVSFENDVSDPLTVAHSLLMCSFKSLKLILHSPRKYPDRFVARCLNAWTLQDASLMKRVVQEANTMNKSAIHIAAQLRDSEQLIDMLVKLGADVNAPTLRGHTPLLYAAGRRHSNAILALLARGASPLTITVTGDSALDMCVKNIGGIERNGCDTKKCTNEAIAAVLAAVVTRRNAEPVEKWRDFRADKDALQAQAEHAKSCKNCLNLLRRKGLLPPLRKPSDIVARLHDTLSRAKSAHDARADDDTVQDELSDLLVAEAAHACDRRACEPASERALRIAALDHAVAWLVGIPLVASADDGGGEEGGFRSSDVRADARVSVQWFARALVAFREERLGRSLQRLRDNADGAKPVRSRGVRKDPERRYPVRLCLNSLLGALRRDASMMIDDVSLDVVLSHADAATASEIAVIVATRRRQRGGGSSPDDSVWTPVEAAALSEIWPVLHDVAWASAHVSFRHRASGGMRTSQIARAMRMISLVRPGLDWTTMLENLVVEAEEASLTLHVWNALSDEARRNMPSSVLERLRGGIALEQSKKKGGVGGVGGGGGGGKQRGSDARVVVKPLAPLGALGLPRCELNASPTIADDVSSIAAIIAEFDSAVHHALDGNILPVGLDSEWSSDVHSDPPAVVQISFIHPQTSHLTAAVVDMLAPTCREPATDLLVRMFSDDRVQLVGFAFAADLRRLAALHRSLEKPANGVRDIQTESMEKLAEREGWGGHTPSLRRCVAALVCEDLDKSEQCSDWSHRPLTKSQVEYAALDAAVLLRLGEELDLINRLA